MKTNALDNYLLSQVFEIRSSDVKLIDVEASLLR
jgi:hypothetical protein